MGCRSGARPACRRKGNEWHARTAGVMAADERFASLPTGAAADLAGEPLPQSFDVWLAGLPDSLLEVMARLAEAGAGVWVVGGSVRDACAGLTAHDHDLATTMRPDQMLALFPRALPTGVRFGTVSLRLEEGNEQYEATTLRTDLEYRDGRRPEEVDFGDSLAQDLRRRDFTINAMAVDLARQHLHDPFGGQSDLEAGCLRAVGDARERLSEDGLRIMRAYRFMDRGDAGLWQPDEALSSALVECQRMLTLVSSERIWHELQLILSGANAAAILDRLGVDGVLGLLLPEWTCDIELQHRCSATGSEAVAARLALLASATDRERVESALRDLTAPRKMLDAVQELRRRLGTLPQATSSAQLRLYRVALGARLEQQLHCESSLDADSTAAVREALSALPANRAGDLPLMDGNRLSESTGLEPGERLGRLKAWLHRIQIEQDIATVADVESALADLDWQDGPSDDWPRVSWP